MIGVYKIKNPENKVYIGSSKNIEKRIKQHKLNSSNKFLKNSILTYGVENHIFEVIEECDIEFLIERERFYINFFDSKGIILNESTVNHVQYKRNIPIGYVAILDEELNRLKKEQSEKKLTTKKQSDIMWDRDKRDCFGNPISVNSKDNSKTIFESGRESRRRIRKENRKMLKP